MISFFTNIPRVFFSYRFSFTRTKIRGMKFSPIEKIKGNNKLKVEIGKWLYKCLVCWLLCGRQFCPDSHQMNGPMKSISQGKRVAFHKKARHFFYSIFRLPFFFVVIDSAKTSFSMWNWSNFHRVFFVFSPLLKTCVRVLSSCLKSSFFPSLFFFFGKERKGLYLVQGDSDFSPRGSITCSLFPAWHLKKFAAQCFCQNLPDTLQDPVCFSVWLWGWVFAWKNIWSWKLHPPYVSKWNEKKKPWTHGSENPAKTTWHFNFSEAVKKLNTVESKVWKFEARIL